MRKINFKNFNVSFCNLFNKPSKNSNLETQCLFGEEINVIELYKEWAYCELINDKYKGWLQRSNLREKLKATHVINNISSLVFYKPDLKSKPILQLFMGSKICSKKNVNSEWLQIYVDKNNIGYIPKSNISRLNDNKINWIDTAIKFRGAPYLWGGKTCFGIDCSALVQISLLLSNRQFPRNSSDQLKFLKKNLYNTENIEKGTLLFWPGHVAIAISKSKIIHSNSFHARVEIENVKDAINRITKTTGPLISLKKLPL